MTTAALPPTAVGRGRGIFASLKSSMERLVAKNEPARKQTRFGSWFLNEQNHCLEHPYTYVDLDGATIYSLGPELLHLREKAWWNTLEQVNFINAFLSAVQRKRT